MKKLSVDKASSVNLKAAILPPLNNTLEPVICPLDFNNKLSLVEFNCVDANSKPPIVPPLNNTCEPVISPLAFTLKLLLDINNSLSTAAPLIKKLEPVIASFVIPNPPINPVSASILPIIFVLPSRSIEKLLELISKLPRAPLIKFLAFPKKNFSVCRVTSEPLTKILPLEPLIKLRSLPKKKAEELITRLKPLN